MKGKNMATENTWKVINEHNAVKGYEKGMFKKSSWDIPKEVASYFENRPVDKDDDVKPRVILIFEGIEYPTEFKNKRTGEKKLVWDTELRDMLHEADENSANELICMFVKIGTGEYDIRFIEGNLKG